ncbi:hypothetical protein KUH03_18575 [Sphingobacterium sp. E70]|nr:hypothetical protein [Sphingobacterium sp. E70]ULT28390.1 hypothetical protein KUH03_18575 [Sphingobacterium sp. E70]
MNAEDENEDVYSAGEQGPIGRISVVSFKMKRSVAHLNVQSKMPMGK